MNAQEILSILEEDEYEYYGIRAMMQNPLNGGYEIVEVGDSVSNSFHWNDGETTWQEINGVCAVKIKKDRREYTPEGIEYSLKVVDDYVFTHGDTPSARQIVLLGCSQIDEGNDHHEIIMKNAEVLAVWDI